ncbi:hypothetical protein GCM10010172_10430 [Paractinoplanes ferrugineus]|uniref:Uncharacterized protein n=1 Tax=Paractinoplanes ferrugineus TaxID=113564 RepID=A0A919IXI0_9ACTN|nr:hypothetical protein Afe05nite_14470 [Actinoplanes ferrugineus]
MRSTAEMGVGTVAWGQAEENRRGLRRGRRWIARVGAAGVLGDPTGAATPIGASGGTDRCHMVGLLRATGGGAAVQILNTWDLLSKDPNLPHKRHGAMWTLFLWLINSPGRRRGGSRCGRNCSTRPGRTACSTSCTA